MEAIFLLDKFKHKRNYDMVYNAQSIEKLSINLDLPKLYFFQEILKKNLHFPGVKYIFSTWNMPKITIDQIRIIFPDLTHIFYAAGDTKYFEKPFIELGVEIIDAKKINSIAVAKYISGIILLFPKKLFYGLKSYRPFINIFSFFQSRDKIDLYSKSDAYVVGVIGAGTIGSEVIKMLDKNDFKIYYYDPFVELDNNSLYNVEKTDLDTLLAESDIITNHLPDILETKDFFDYNKFCKMKDSVLFINSGRGNQVNEVDLHRFMKKNKSAFAILDVTKREPLYPFSKILYPKNIFITPHIAGCMGSQKSELGNFVVSEFVEIIRK